MMKFDHDRPDLLYLPARHHLPVTKLIEELSKKSYKVSGDEVV